jgi:hypothetical protein
MRNRSLVSWLGTYREHFLHVGRVEGSRLTAHQAPGGSGCYHLDSFSLTSVKELNLQEVKDSARWVLLPEGLTVPCSGAGKA